MYYWFRPQIHLCDSHDDERALCGTEITGLSPTVRPLLSDVDPTAYFADRDAKVCENCVRIFDTQGSNPPPSAAGRPGGEGG